VDAQASIQSAIDICQSEINGKQLHVDFETPPAPVWLHADAARLQQVFWNLIKNAVKFTPSKGRLQIHTHQLDGNLAVVVTDTGAGIEPDLLPKIFNAFEQGSAPRADGLGLGLAITKALVSLHGGTISAQSAGRECGATFTVTLPVGEAPAPAKAVPSEANAESVVRRSLRVLLVEDHEDTNRSMCRLLRNRGYEVQSAFTVSEALGLSDGYEFEVLISDIGLPDGTGLDLLQQLPRERGFSAIALSGYGMEDDVQSAHRAGFNLHLTKPVDIGTLDRALQSFASVESRNGSAAASL
jgi:two-component system CheB/CheR fusion protein